MIKYLTTATVLVVVSLVVLVGAKIASRFQQQPMRRDTPPVPLAKQKNLTQAEYENQFPIVEYAAPEPDEKYTAKYLNAEKRYNKGQLPISEYSERTITHTNWELGLPALPVEQ